MGNDYRDIYEELDSDKTDPALFGRLKNCCFIRNKYFYQFDAEPLSVMFGFLNENEAKKLDMLISNKMNAVVLNKTVTSLLDSFDGKRNVQSIFDAIESMDLNFFIFELVRYYRYTIEFETIRDADKNGKSVFTLDGKFENFIRLIKMLRQFNLIDLVDYRDESEKIQLDIKDAGKINLERPTNTPEIEIPAPGEDAKSSRVLLFGESGGQSSVALLYLASYLRRNGVEAFCQWNNLNTNKTELKENVERLLEKIRPDIVGVSMKWFPHIARVLEICRIVKAYSPSIKVVLGGNTASYYWKNFIENDYVDSIILGDGELPLLKMCRGEKEIPNCVYKKSGEVIKTDWTYVQGEDSDSEMYLSNFNDIFTEKVDPYSAFWFYIPTGKGCSMNCFYCGGCREAQKKTYNRPKPFLRNIEMVRKDIELAKNYSGILLFDFDLPNYDSTDYYEKLFNGIDFSRHFCMFFFWAPPSREFIQLVTKAFKYVYFGLDMCSLSDTHRQKLTKLGLVKPQTKDDELFVFLDECEKYDNVEAHLHYVAGLPEFGFEDIEESNRTLDRILNKYKGFARLYCGHLHAQPGAPIATESGKYNMESRAETFEDFLHYSRLNLDADPYPNVAVLHYPLITSKSEELRNAINQAYDDMEKKLEEASKEISAKIELLK